MDEVRLLARVRPRRAGTTPGTHIADLAPTATTSQLSWNNTNVQAADLIVNAGIGFGVGVVASVLLFRSTSSTINNTG
jgi:hypothetical protein